jgi:hypothetical protein
MTLTDKLPETPVSLNALGETKIWRDAGSGGTIQTEIWRSPLNENISFCKFYDHFL